MALNFGSSINLSAPLLFSFFSAQTDLNPLPIPIPIPREILERKRETEEDEDEEEEEVEIIGDGFGPVDLEGERGSASP